MEKSSVHNVLAFDQTIFAMTYDYGLIKSTNKGVNWEQAEKGLPNLYTFQVLSVNSTLLAGQWTGIFKSTDGGKNWVISSRGLPFDSAVKELLHTKFGIIAVAVTKKLK